MPAVPPFDSAAVGATSSSTVLVMNNGSSSVTALAASIGGTDSSSFMLETDTCSGHDLDAGGGCTLLIGFHPKTAGVSSASLMVEAHSARPVSTALTASATSILSVIVNGPGTGRIVSDPPGISCSTGMCTHEFDVASVRLMADSDPSSGFAAWSGGGCSGAGVCVVALDAASRTIDATFTKVLCVNATTGDDSNTGECSSPLKTITKATSLASSGYTIQVAPGRYGTVAHGLNGEQFPIIVPAGVALVGDEATKGVGAPPVSVSGDGLALSGNYATIYPASGATIAGIEIATSSSSPNSPFEIYLDESSTGVTIRNNTLLKGVCGIRLQGGGHIISGNAIQDQAAQTTDSFPFGSGIWATNASAKVEGNTITRNKYAIVMDGSVNALDIGGGGLSSAGQNAIYCNSGVAIVDLVPGDSLFATNNSWDHSPPIIGNPPLITCLGLSGVDFCGITLMSQPSMVAGGTCP